MFQFFIALQMGEQTQLLDSGAPLALPRQPANGLQLLDAAGVVTYLILFILMDFLSSPSSAIFLMLIRR